MMVRAAERHEPELASNRLRFDRWLKDDFTLIYGLHADPRVQVGYSAGPEAWTEEAIQQRLTDYIAEQDKIGFSKWKLSLQDGTFIGRAGWSRWGKSELEIGYAIKPVFQGHGYASEACKRLIEWGQERRSERLVGFALLNNSASRHILQRAGMVYDDDRLINGVLNAFYSVPR